MVKEDSLTVIKISLKLRIVVNRARLWRSGHYVHSTDRIVVIIFPVTIVASAREKALIVKRAYVLIRSRVEIEPPRRRGSRWHREDARSALAKKLLLEKIYKTAINKKKRNIWKEEYVRQYLQ